MHSNTTTRKNKNRPQRAPYFNEIQGGAANPGGKNFNTSKEKFFKKGEFLFLPSERADKVYLITKGRVKLGQYSESGKEMTKAILSQGELFGEGSLVREEKRSEFACALENTTCQVLSSRELKGLIQKDPGLSLYLIELLGSRMLEMEERLKSVVFKDCRTRIIEFIHELGRKKGQQIGGEILVRKFLTHQEIASFTATSRKTVNIVLNELRRSNLIHFTRERLLIRDLEQLAKEARTGGATPSHAA